MENTEVTSMLIETICLLIQSWMWRCLYFLG